MTTNQNNAAQELPDFNSPEVQAVYETLCGTAWPPAGEHWEGWVSRHIVLALRKLRAPVADERAACPTDVCHAAKADGVLCANDECDRANGVRPAGGYTPDHDQPHHTGVGEWCAPGPAADQRRAWLLRFADADRGDCVYYDEQEARRAFAQAEGRGWNCYLFEYARRAVLASAPVAGEAQPVAWANEDGDPISDALKQARPDLYGKHYTRPLVYAAPQASEAVRNVDLQQCAGDNALSLLAEQHTGMRVDYQGLLRQAREGLRDAPGLAEMLRQLQGHLRELGQRWYAGDTAVVDELLQLYCVESDARAALSAQPGAQK